MADIFFSEFKELKDAVDKLKTENDGRRKEIVQSSSKLCEDIQTLKGVNSELVEEIRILKEANSERCKDLQILREANSDRCDDMQSLKEANLKQCEEMQNLNLKHLDTISDLQNEVSKLKDQIENLSVTSSQQHDENDLLKKEMLTVQEKMGELWDKEAEEGHLGNPADPSIGSDSKKIGRFTKKMNRLDRTYTEFKKSVGELRYEVNVGMKSMEENFVQAKQYCSRTDRLQKMFNNLHLSLQSRKDMGEEVQRVITEVDSIKEFIQPIKERQGATAKPELSLVLPPLWTGQHPSKRAVPSSVAKEQLERRQDLVKRTKFKVVLDKLTMERDARAWIGDYTEVIEESEFMDPKSGIFTVPVKGKYRCHSKPSSVVAFPTVYICCDRNDFQDSSYLLGSNGWRQNNVDVTCEAGDKIWVEVQGKGNDSFRHNEVTNLAFSGTLLL